jgi:two-component system, OmpR family, response regulator RegX3
MAYIVLVEDNKDVAEVVCDALRAEGHRCFVIRSKTGAERFFRRVRPDLVVLDCLLIGGDGLQLAKQLASETNVPVIVTSGDIDKAEQAVKTGLLCFQKPFRLSDLASRGFKTFGRRGRSDRIQQSASPIRSSTRSSSSRQSRVSRMSCSSAAIA